MALPYDTKNIPYYGRSTSESGGGGIIFYNIIDRPCGIVATTRMNNSHPHQQQQQQNRLRYMEDFNEFVSQGINDVDDSLNDNNNNNYPLLSNIDRSPIRSNINRAQSARHSWEVNHSNNTHHHHPSYIENSNGGIQDDTAATMMLMIRNGTLKPQAKRSRRTVSAPQIPPFDSTFNDNNDTNNNDLLDLFDIDDDNQIRLTSSENDYNSSYSTMNHQSNSKAIRSQSHDEAYFSSTLNDRSITATTTTAAAAPTATTITSSSLTRHGREYPFYSYIDHSQEVDMTPDVPLTAMGRVPTFLAKLHAILLRPELQHIVAWLPHGRSWKVYQAVEFEKQVIAVYFEFTKHPNSSFFRQAKLWGFLRIKQTGMDHDSYYHPRFVRGLPHLCKDVRRPPASHLPDVPPVGQEPNLTMISEIHPVPPSSNAILHDPTIHLDWFMKGKQQQQSKTSGTFRYPPPIKEGMAKKTSSSTSASTDFSSTHSIVKRKRSTQEENKDRRSEVYQNHHTTEYDIEPIEINVPSGYDIPNRLDDIININIDDDDDDDDEPPIDDDLGLNLDPYFSKGYHLYPFYDYIDYSSNMDMYPLQPYTDIGQEPTFPMLLHAMLLWQQQQSTTTSESSIQWQPHGRAWKICSVAKFEAEILPMFFVTQHVGPNDTNHTAGSFFRHVTRWGFKRIDQPQPSQPSTNHKPTNSSDIGCYYHPKFLRGLPHLCKDWNMNDATSASSLSTSPLISEDDEYNHTSNNQGSDPNHNEYPEPDFTKISQLHPVPNYDPNATVEDLLGCDWFLR